MSAPYRTPDPVPRGTEPEDPENPAARSLVEKVIEWRNARAENNDPGPYVYPTTMREFAADPRMHRLYKVDTSPPVDIGVRLRTDDRVLGRIWDVWLVERGA